MAVLSLRAVGALHNMAKWPIIAIKVVSTSTEIECRKLKFCLGSHTCTYEPLHVLRYPHFVTKRNRVVKSILMKFS